MMKQETKQQKTEKRKAELAETEKIKRTPAECLKNTGRRMAADVRAYGWVILLFAVYYVLVKTIFHAFCPMVIVSGLPCPGCGMTRAVWFLATGQPGRSLRLHPLGIFWVALTLYGGVSRYLCGKRVKWGVQLFAGLIGVTVLVYLYRMYTQFPGPAPMSYTPRNLLARLIPGYSGYIRRIFSLLR